MGDPGQAGQAGRPQDGERLVSTVPIPPQDVPAERAILGALLIAPGAFHQARGLISDSDWYRPAHELIWAAMCELDAKGEAIDAVTVGAALNTSGKMARVGDYTYLADLATNVITTVNLEYHITIVANLAVRRHFIEAMTRLAQMAGNVDSEMDAMLAEAQTQLDLVAGMSVGDGPIRGLHDWHEFLALHAGQLHNWVVPGMIGRKDVWLILAPPGAGKSTLSRQIAWGIAAGVHPFRQDLEIEARRTLLVDLENDEGMTADDSVDYFARFDSLGDGVEDRGLIWAHPEGIDLLNPKDAHKLDQVLTQANPDFVALGSLNNSFVRKGDWDQAAGGVREVINRLRVKHQTAFWIEGHMPKGNDGMARKTPFGSQIFSAWPSHGRVLERVADNLGAPFSFAPAFRGDRGKREMPCGFTRGGRYPWTAIWDEGELQVLTEACT
jgi:hypothetical protein